jgi:hypothetical protein
VTETEYNVSVTSFKQGLKSYLERKTTLKGKDKKLNELVNVETPNKKQLRKLARLERHATAEALHVSGSTETVIDWATVDDSWWDKWGPKIIEFLKMILPLILAML